MSSLFTKKSTRLVLTLILLSLLQICCTRGGGGSNEESSVVVLAVGGKTAAGYIPLTIAEQKGFFREEGLEVEVQDLQGGAKALQALVAGSTDVVVGYFDHTIQMQARGKDITGMVLLARYPGLVFGVRADLANRVHKPSDLKQMKIGVTAPGSSSHFMVQYLLSREGLRPEDVSAIGVGVGSTAIAALEQKQIDALVTMDPAATVLESRGLFKILADTRTAEDTLKVYGGSYPGASVYTTREFIDQRPTTALKLARAFTRALEWMKGKNAEEIAEALPDSYFGGDRQLYLNGIARSIQMFSPDGRFEPADSATVHEVLSLFDEVVRSTKIDLTRTYTNRFVNQSAN